LLPQSKHDTEKAEALIALGYPAVAPIIPELLTWLQDRNWPVGRVLAPFLASLGAAIAPAVRTFLSTDDEFWKYGLVVDVVAHSAALADALTPELERIIATPTAGEKAEGLPDEVREILTSFRSKCR
jgi:hypothetical protein